MAARLSNVGPAGGGGGAGVLLDRDGTIIVDHGHVGSIDRVELIDGSPEAIAAFNRADIPVAVITNQAGVAKGLYSIDDVEKVHRYLAERLADYGARVDLFLYCPYHPDGIVERYARRSFDRKPEPGMALAAAKALDLDLTSSWVVGDRPEDMALASAVGAFGVFIGPETEDHLGICAFPDLFSVAPFIVDQTKATTRLNPLSPLGASAGRPKFPKVPIEQAAPYTMGYLMESSKAAASIDLVQLARASTTLLEAYKRGAVVFACGNGGSAAIANHLQCDHLKGVRTGTDLMPRVVSLSTNIELITAIANDRSYDEIFVYQLQSQARPGDILVAISSSGRSRNIVRCLQWARENDLRTIALLGFDGGEVRELADIVIHVDSANYGVIEDNHQAIMHILAQYIRQSVMTPEAIAIESF
jgi:D,D-heptose 1,7-bisphosphate phosphatase